MSVCNPKNQQVSTIFWVIYSVCACTVVNEFQILSKRGQLIILIMLCWYDGLIVLNSLCSFVWCQAFFADHPHLAENDFYITGESYAGHYIPAFAARVHRGNKAKEGIHINLKVWLITNSCFQSIIYVWLPPSNKALMGQKQLIRDLRLEMGLQTLQFSIKHTQIMHWIWA